MKKSNHSKGQSATKFSLIGNILGFLSHLSKDIITFPIRARGENIAGATVETLSIGTEGLVTKIQLLNNNRKKEFGDH